MIAQCDTQKDKSAPDFFLVGAARSGTSALTQYLEQHPGVFISDPKESHYFAFRETVPSFRGPGDSYFNRSVVVNDSAYEKLYRKAKTDQVCGDASASYLYYTHSLNAIHQANPNAKIICLLRQPVDRAYSAYMYLRSRLLEPDGCFESAFQQEQKRIQENWHHLWHYEQVGRYREQLTAVFDTFDTEQVLTLVYDDFRDDPMAVVSQCFEFIGVDFDFVPSSTPASLVSGVPRSKVLQSVLQSDFLKSCLRPVLPSVIRNKIQSTTTQLNVSREKLDSEIRQSMTSRFKEDIEYVEQTVGRKLKWN